jgi:hypothetical protein
MAQAVSRQPLPAEGRDRSGASACGICGMHSVTGSANVDFLYPAFRCCCYKAHKSGNEYRL